MIGCSGFNVTISANLFRQQKVILAARRSSHMRLLLRQHEIEGHSCARREPPSQLESRNRICRAGVINAGDPRIFQHQEHDIAERDCIDGVTRFANREGYGLPFLPPIDQPIEEGICTLLPRESKDKGNAQNDRVGCDRLQGFLLPRPWSYRTHSEGTAHLPRGNLPFFPSKTAAEDVNSKRAFALTQAIATFSGSPRVDGKRFFRHCLTLIDIRQAASRSTKSGRVSWRAWFTLVASEISTRCFRA